MPPPVPEQLSRTIETLYRSESGRVLATLVRLLGDLDVAEEAMPEAFAPLWSPGLGLVFRTGRTPG
jgi:RNA polymerase sigma-70 factor (ECF subfamily)